MCIIAVVRHCSVTVCAALFIDLRVGASNITIDKKRKHSNDGYDKDCSYRAVNW